MKVRPDNIRSVRISGEYIKLDSLLKYVSIASTGGEAKYLIKSGEITVGKDICLQRGKKIRPGEIVRYGKNVILIK